MSITELWESNDESSWEKPLERYWELVKPKNRELERSLDNLDVKRLSNMTPDAWYHFLEDEYFRWKYTAANRYATTTNKLKCYLEEEDGLVKLDEIRQELTVLDPTEISQGLKIATKIRGLGIAGASGLLSLLYPENYGTVDQFVVKSLRKVENLPEAKQIAEMKEEDLSHQDGILLIEVMRRKACELNKLFNSKSWTPRKLDKILWVFDR